jgi:hypothetical protein
MNKMQITFLITCIIATLAIVGTPTSFNPKSLLAQQDQYPESGQAFEQYNQTKTPPEQINATEATKSHVQALQDALNEKNYTKARDHLGMIETQQQLLQTNKSAQSTAESGPIGPASFQPEQQRGQYQLGVFQPEQQRGQFTPVSHCTILIWDPIWQVWRLNWIVGCI